MSKNRFSSTELNWLHCFWNVLNSKLLVTLFSPCRTWWFSLVSHYFQTSLSLSKILRETRALPTTPSHPTPEATVRSSSRGRRRVQLSTSIVLERATPPQAPLWGKEGGPDVGLWRTRSPSSILWRRLREANRSVGLSAESFCSKVTPRHD